MCLSVLYQLQGDSGRMTALEIAFSCFEIQSGMLVIL